VSLTPSAGTDRVALAGRRIAVTGALGFVASHLIPRLLSRSARVIAVVRPGRDASALEREGCSIRAADLSAGEARDAWFAGCDAAVHLAGIAQAVTLVPALEAAGALRAVFVGSAGVYTRLESRGADAKRRGEARIRESSLAWTILRPSMIYGSPRDRNLARLLRWLERCPIAPVPGGGRTAQQPVHVDDLSDAIVAALERPVSSRREYDIAGPEPIPLASLILESARALERSVWLLPIPLGPVHWVARTARRWKVPFPVSPEQVLRLEESKAVDITPARRDLDFNPRSFGDGIQAEARELRSARPPHGRHPGGPSPVARSG